MSEHLERLHPSARQVLGASKAIRIRQMKVMRWITYTRAQQIFNRLELLLDHPKKDRMPCLLLIGETNSGKSELIKQFLKSHAADENLAGEAIIQHVRYVQAPPTPSESALLDEILKGLFEPTLKNEGVDPKRVRVCGVLKRSGLKMLIIDEIHHLLQGTTVKQRAFLNSLKYISNALAIPIVGLGTEEARVAISTSPELASRFKSEVLQRWIVDDEAERLLASMESLLPLEKPSELYAKALLQVIIDVSEGKIGEIADLVVSAASHAIEIGEERITLKTIRECGYAGPVVRDYRDRNAFLPQ